MSSLTHSFSQKFHFVATEDGSPSLSWRNDNDVFEGMHNFEGALSESLYIYDFATELLQKKGLPVRVLSLGLGLGYNELLFLCRAFKYFKDKEIQLISFEKNFELRSKFVKWLLQCDDNLYDGILKMCAEQFELSPQVTLKFNRQLYKSGSWKVLGDVQEQSNSMQKYCLIFYDAYSSKTSPELWSTDWIDKFLKQFCDSKCIFTTYAATTVLKNSLKNSGFQIQKRPGFKGKRESTLAIRF